MFVDPIFEQGAMSKESSAVNSEYEIDVNEDDWKIQNLLTVVTKSDHPMSRFSIGNHATLIENT